MLVAMGLAGFLALLAVVLAGLSAFLLKRLSQRVMGLERQARTLANESRSLHQKLDALPTEPEAPLALATLNTAVNTSVTIDTGMNLSKRVQILRLSRRGESSAHIASLLNIPLAQVELVLKLQKHMGEATPRP
jgi:DNA-binding NarL/FixJ family response regulator